MKLAKDLNNQNIEIDEKRLITERTFICSMTRFGKCGQFDIVLSNGTIKKVKDIKIGDVILSLDNHYKIVNNKVLALKDNGVKSVYEVITNDGRKVKVSKEHPFLTENGKWRKLKELNVRDYIAVPRVIPIEGKKEYDINKIKILGYLLGDGCLTVKNNIFFSNGSKKILNEVRKILPEGHYLKYLKKDGYAIRHMSRKRNSHKINKFIKECQLSGKNSHTKFIPDFIFGLKNQYAKVLINRMFACDGWASISNNHPQIGYCSVSNRMILQIQHLLLRLDILSSISKKKVSYRNEIRIAYILSINGKDNMLKFIENIGIYSKEKALDKIKKLYELKKTNDSGDKIPKSFIKSNNLSHYLYKSKRKYNTNKKRESIGRKTIQAYANEFNDSYLKKVGYSDIIWRRIKEINYLYDDMVYDISVEKNHNFIGNDFFVHNSYCMRKIAEEVFGKVGIIIIDPEGEYASLRDKFPFLIVGKDIPLNPDTAEFIAETVLKENLSVIIDSSTSDTIDEQEFVRRFIDRFMDLELTKKKSYLFMIEESDEFAPERGVYKSGSLRSVINLAKKGAKRGLGLILATQRPAMISKFVLSQCVNQIIGHTEWSGDRKVLQQYLRMESEVIDKIPELKAGEFYFKGNFIEQPQILKINHVETTHLGGTPTISPPTTKELKEVISKLSKSLPKVVEEKLKPSIPDTKIIESKIREKIEKEFKSKLDKLNTQLKISKKQEIPKEEIENIINERVEKETDEYKGKFQEQEIKINTLQKFVNSMVSKGKQILGEREIEMGVASPDENLPIPSNLSYDVWLDKFKGGNRKILELMIKYKKLTKSQMIIMSGYKKSNLNSHILPTLKKASLIQCDNENVMLIGG